MRFFIIIPLVLLTVTVSHGQRELAEIDSLQDALSRETTAARQADLENLLANLYYNIDLKKSLRYGQSALDHAKESKYEYGQHRAYAILRRIQRRLGNFNVAIEYSLANLPRLEALRDTTELIDTYSSMGNNYASLQNFREANRYLFKAYAMGSKVNAPSLPNIMNFIGRSYAKMNKLDSAQYWIERALAVETQYPQPGYALYYIHNNLAEVFYLKKEFQKALDMYQKALNLPEEKKNRLGETFSYTGLALVYKDMKEYDKAIAMANRGLAVARKNAFRDRIKEAYGALHEIYEARKDYKNALYFYKQFNIYQDSIFSEDKIQYIENLKINYETEKMEQENQLLKKDADLKDAILNQQRALVLGSTIAVSLLVVTLIFQYRNVRQKKNTNRLLEKYNHDLESQVEERTRELMKTNLELVRQNSQLEQFGYITAHNLRAPVARILGLANVINSTSFEMPKDKEVLDKLQLSAEDLDTIIFDLNGILDIKKGVHSSYEEVNIPERLEKVRSVLKDKIRETNTRITQDLKVERCFAIPAYIESIFYNLISNGIKYRAPERDPEIHISSFLDGDKLKLIVKDNGLGIDLDRLKEKVFSLYQRFHSHVEGKGLGLFLVKTQVEALNGTIEVESTVGTGTKFIITIPLAQQA